MSCDVAKATEGLENELWRRWTDGKVGECAHSPTFPVLHLRHSSFSNPSVLHLRHSSFSNPSVASPMSQLILQPFRCFTYVTAHSPTLPSLHLRHSSFSNPSFASHTPQALHLRHLASRPCYFTFVYFVSIIWPPQCIVYNPRGLQSKCHEPNVTKGNQTMDQNSRQVQKGWSPWICNQQNVRANTRDNKA